MTTRVDLVAELHALAARGYVHPDDLPLDDPVVSKVRQRIARWIAISRNRAGTNIIRQVRYRFSASCLYVDAGFTHPSYLTEVVSWLNQELDVAEDTNAFKLVTSIRTRIEQLEDMIGRPVRIALWPVQWQVLYGELKRFLSGQALRNRIAHELTVNGFKWNLRAWSGNRDLMFSVRISQDQARWLLVLESTTALSKPAIHSVIEAAASQCRLSLQQQGLAPSAGSRTGQNCT